MTIFFFPKMQHSGVSRQEIFGNHCSSSVVLKVVDIDPQGSIGPSKGSINSHRVEWELLNVQGVNE